MYLSLLALASAASAASVAKEELLGGGAELEKGLLGKKNYIWAKLILFLFKIIATVCLAMFFKKFKRKTFGFFKKSCDSTATLPGDISEAELRDMMKEKVDPLYSKYSGQITRFP